MGPWSTYGFIFVERRSFYFRLLMDPCDHDLLPHEPGIKSTTAVTPNSGVPVEGEDNDDVVVQLRVQPCQLRFTNPKLDGNLSLEICIHGVPHEKNAASPIRSSTNSEQWYFDHISFDYPIRGAWISHLDSATDDINRMARKKQNSLKSQMLQATKNGLLFPYRTAALTLQSKSSCISTNSMNSHREILCSLEFVLWSIEEHEKVFVSEYSLSLGKWAVAHAEHAAWPSFPFDIPLKGSDEKMSANLEVRIGLLPVFHDHQVALVTRALQKMSGENAQDPYHAPSTQTIGMREEVEDFADDGITDEDQLDDENGLSSDSEHDGMRNSLEAITLDPQGPQDTRRVVGLKNDPDGKNNSAQSVVQQDRRASRYTLDTTLTSDTDVFSENDLYKKSWSLRRSSIPKTGSKSDSGSLPHIILPSTSKKKLRHKRRMAEAFNLKTMPRNDLLGIVMVEVISAHDLPRWRNMTNTSFDMDPFVVVSFHRKVFRTRILRHTLNPEWREKLLLHVHENELSYNIRCAVYDWDNMTANDYVGELSLDLQNILSAAPIPNPESGLYDLHNDQPIHSMYYDLPLSRERGDEDQKFGSNKPTLQLKAVFQPYDALRQRFWLEMLRLYDTNETGGVDIDELQILLLSLGSTLTEKTVNGFFSRFGKVAGQDELTFPESIQALERELLKPKSERRQVHSLDSQDQLDDDACSADDDCEHIERVIQLSTCPICLRPRLSRADEADIVTHLALCTSKKGRSVDDIMVSNFVTATQAQRKWYTNVFTVLSQGHYRIGANSANILIQNRLTGQVIEEKMQVYVRLGIRLLYQGAKSRMNGARARRMLRNLTIKQGRKYDNPNSVRAIQPFISFHGINMDEMVEPVESFSTFNEFFCRKIRMALRPLAEPENPCVLVSCADCRLLAFESVNRATTLWIKGRQFSVNKLLGDIHQRQAPQNPSLVIFRLAPQDYHRFHSPVDGVIGDPERIEGEYYTVNPMAIRSSIDVFGENTRAVVPIYTKEFGTVILTAIGAMMVGSIVFTFKPGQSIKRGEELGYFKFGGSTLVLLVDRARVRWDPDLLANADTCMETLVRVGMRLGEARS